MEGHATGTPGGESGGDRSAGSGARAARVGLVALLLWAGALRIWLALPEAHAGRWWDERFNVANVVGLLERGEPRNFWYGGLSYAPQALVLELAEIASAATGEERLAVRRGRTLTATGYRLCRLLQVVYGLASLVVVFLLGKELASPTVGLAAAFLLAASQRHVHASAIFKPDVLLLLATLLAVLWSVRAARDPGPRRLLLAGAGVGLAAASKLNGVTAAVPLLVAAVPLARRSGRRWLAFGGAAGAAAAVYLAFNPYLRGTLRHLAENRAHYAQTATGSHLAVLLETLGYLFHPTFHGPVVGAVSVVGFAAVAWAAAAGKFAAERRLQWAMVLGYPLAYYLLYALATNRAKANHFLQILPFSSLLAAFALVTAGTWLAARLPGARRRLLPGLAVPAAAWVAAGPMAYVYREAVPHTGEQAAAFLRAALPPPQGGRHVVAEVDAVRPEAAGGGLGAGLLAVGRLTEVEPEALDLADAEVFVAGRLEGTQGDSYFRRVQQDPAAQRVARFERGWFQAWGPDLVVLLHPLTLEEAVELRPGSLREAAVRTVVVDSPPGLGAGDLVSVQIRLPAPLRKLGAVRLTAGARELALAPVLTAGDRSTLLSPRFFLASPPAPLALHLGKGSVPTAAIVVTFLRWSPPGKG